MDPQHLMCVIPQTDNACIIIIYGFCVLKETEVKPPLKDQHLSCRPERGLPFLSRVVVLINSLHIFVFFFM